MPMDEYIAGVLAGEVGNFKSDEALKAMAVAARTYAMHFGSRHAQEGFDLCDTTHCQDLRIAGIDARLRKIASDTSGEILWYEGEPAATYYNANCGGTTEDGRYTLGNDEAPAPYLTQHSDTYCVRNGVLQWRSWVTKRELQSALRGRWHRRSGAAARGCHYAAHAQRAGGVGARHRVGEHHGPGAGLPLCRGTAHWLGAAEEQLVRSERDRRQHRVSRARFRDTAWACARRAPR